MTLYSETYRIAEEAHKGRADDYIKHLCREAARQFNVDWLSVYKTAESIYAREFESR